MLALSSHALPLGAEQTNPVGTSDHCDGGIQDCLKTLFERGETVEESPIGEQF